MHEIILSSIFRFSKLCFSNVGYATKCCQMYPTSSSAHSTIFMMNCAHKTKYLHGILKCDLLPHVATRGKNPFMSSQKCKTSANIIASEPNKMFLKLCHLICIGIV